MDHGINQLGGQYDTGKLFQERDGDESLVGVSSREDGSKEIKESLYRQPFREFSIKGSREAEWSKKVTREKL